MSEPTPENSANNQTEAQRLALHLNRSQGQFSLAFVRWNHPGQQASILPLIRKQLNNLFLVELHVDISVLDSLVLQLETAWQQKKADVLFVYGLEKAFPDFLQVKETDRPPILVALNIQRELWRRNLSCPVVVWLPEHALRLIAQGAPDFWSWRSGLFEFSLDVPQQLHLTEKVMEADPESPRLSMQEIHDRIQQALSLWNELTKEVTESSREDETKAKVAAKLARLYARLKEFELANQYRREAIKIWQKTADHPQASRVKSAEAKTKIAQLLMDIPTGNRSEALVKAIEYYRAALEVYNRTDFPNEWASTQNNLGYAYGKLPTGDQGQNLHQAIACFHDALLVYTEQDFPDAWASTQNNLGNAFLKLPTGEQSLNLHQAINYYQAALRIRTEQDYPVDWARTQNNLGLAYMKLPHGDRSQNLQQAIEYHQAALRVRTQHAFPDDWARTQNNLGLVYMNMPAGDRGQNLLQAITCYLAALQVTTEEDFPRDYADTMANIGLVFQDAAQQKIILPVIALPTLSAEVKSTWDIAEHCLGESIRVYSAIGDVHRVKSAQTCLDDLRRERLEQQT